MIDVANKIVRNELKELLLKLEETFDADFLNICGPINNELNSLLLHVVEKLAADPQKRDSLLVMITTGGGDALAVERMVRVLRHHYNEVNFIVPDYAYSAGTIFCMSGDNIYMDYYSALGPIDPQILNKDGRWVPALGYLDKVKELIDKAQSNTLTEAEFLILKDFDLAEIRAYEQAKELTIDLLKEWLVKYKFKNWDRHRDGRLVTMEEKSKKASEIAEELNNYGRWKSHGRPLDIDVLSQIGLKIEDFGKDEGTKSLVRKYYGTMKDYTMKNGFEGFVQTRKDG